MPRLRHPALMVTGNGGEDRSDDIKGAEVRSNLLINHPLDVHTVTRQAMRFADSQSATALDSRFEKKETS